MIEGKPVAVKNCRQKKSLYIILVSVALIAISMLSISCVCPLFSLLERMTGLEISTGKNIDTGAIEDELIYPGSLAIVQINGDMDRVLELIGEYGVALSEDELEMLEHLPERIKEQEVGTTVYSTPDKKMDVTDYYISLRNRGWKISDFGDAGESLRGNSMIIAEKEERKQALMIAGTESNSFIIFMDFDWSMIEVQ